MTLIELYNEAKRSYERLASDRDKILGLDSDQNDKHRFQVSFSKLSSDQWGDMIFHVHVSHGYYGSSSGYSDSSELLGKYLAVAIKEQSKSLLDRVVELAKKDMLTAKNNAVNEAKSVLENISTKEG